MVESKAETNSNPFPKTHKEILATCRDYKTQGNTLFKEKDYKRANTKYSRVALFAKGVFDDGEGGD